MHAVGKSNYNSIANEFNAFGFGSAGETDMMLTLNIIFNTLPRLKYGYMRVVNHAVRMSER